MRIASTTDMKAETFNKSNRRLDVNVAASTDNTSEDENIRLEHTKLRVIKRKVELSDLKPNQGVIGTV